MIHYHGLPITPATAAIQAINCGHAFIRFGCEDQARIAVEVCQSFAVDNGAFSAWKSGSPVSDWSGYYSFAANMSKIPSCDFSVIPDVIDGGEADNDALIAEWPLPRWFGAPVWHMHERISRLVKLATMFPRICIGSSGNFSVVGNLDWWARIDQAFESICDSEGRPWCRVHGLRMLNTSVFSILPFASADSTNIGRNVGIDQRWKGTYTPPSKDVRAHVIRSRIEAFNAPATWVKNRWAEQNRVNQQ